MLKLTVEQRLERAVAAIMNDDRFRMLSGLLLLGKRSVVPEDHQISTACTDGKNELYNRAFADKLSDAELRFVLLHEVYHKMYRHLTTWQHLWRENPQLANAAMDYVINIQLKDSDPDARFIRMPECGLVDEKYRSWDTARVYNDLKKNPPQGGKGGGKGKGGSKEVPGSDGFDEHDWESAQEMSEAEQRDLSDLIDRAIQQGALQAGKTGAHVNRDLLDLTRPKVNWREVLRQFVKTISSGRDYSTWSRPNRRYLGSGYYMPSSISETMGDIVVGVDTSGSIGAKELSAFISEVQGVCEETKPANVHLVYWGHQIDGVEVYPRDELSTLAASTKPMGGGGTDVNCLAEYVKEKGLTPEAIVVLTDGYLGGGWGTWNAPVLWGIINNRSAVPTVGTALHIETDRY